MDLLAWGAFVSFWIRSQPNLGRWGHQTNGTQVCVDGS